MKTITEIQNLMQQWSTNPRKKLGQNFLISKSVIDKITDAVESFSPERVIEVGPGLGAITDKLMELKYDLTLIELDKYFCQYWQEQGQNIILADALQLDWKKEFSQRFTLVSNLPYQISSSIVIDRSIKSYNCDSMVLMFQKEVAQRITAASKSKTYGMLSVIAQSFWAIEKVVDAGPKDFYPPPQVASRVLRFERLNENMPEAMANQFLSFIKYSFDQRRKKLLPRLNSRYPNIEWPSVFQSLQINSEVRPEVINPEQYLEMFKQIK